MAVESGLENAGSYIDTLDDNYPAGGDDLVEGDDHIRGIKNCLINSFPSIAGAVTSTHTELNLLDGATVTTAEINYNDITTLGTVQANKTVTANSSAYVTFDTSSSQKQIRFSSSVGPSLSFLYGNPSGSIGLYDNANARGVWEYIESTNTFEITPPLTASGGITGNVTGNVTGDVTGNADTATSATTATTATTATSNLTTDAVGSFAFLRHETLNTSLAYGTNYAGSLLTPTGLRMSSSGSTIVWDESSDSSRTGTWKCLGNVTASAGFYSAGLFVRVV